MRHISRRSFIPFLIGVTWFGTLARPLFAGENYALLVAVGDYDPQQLPKLSYTRNDVRDFRAVLLQSGLKPQNVATMHDDPRGLPAAGMIPEAAKIRKQLTLILSGREEDDSVILAFAGHGVQFRGDDANYFCPLDTDLERKETLISLKEIYDAMQACPAKKKLLLVDACRNDPRTVASRSRSTVDLESVTRPQRQPVPESVVAFFSCAAGQRSFESPDLGHGVFFYHVLDVWKQGVDNRKELTLDDLVFQTRQRTESYARTTFSASQTPEFQGKTSGRWVLRTFSTEILTNSIGMKLARIPAGESVRGSPDAEREAIPNEKPQHRIRLTKDFLMGTHEVTRGQFRKFVEATGYRTIAEKDGRGGYIFDLKQGNAIRRGFTWKAPGFAQTDEHPVVLVNWDDANAFCDWLKRKEGRPYRLPTEAEWEYACRGRTTSRWSIGDNEIDLRRVANIADGAVAAESPIIRNWTMNWNDGFVQTAPVGRFQPNLFGLYDMHGNVIEWCADWFDDGEYAQYAGRTAIDPKGPAQGTKRTLRGGGWCGAPVHQRSAFRGGADSAQIGGDAVGFRVAADLSNPSR